MDQAAYLRLVDQATEVPTLMEKVQEETDSEDLAEVCGAVETVLRESCLDRGMDKHAGIACLFMVITRLTDPDRERIQEGEP